MLPEQSQGPEFMTVAQVAEFLQVTQEHVRNMLTSGKLRAYTYGPKTIRIRRSEILRPHPKYRGQALDWPCKTSV